MTFMAVQILCVILAMVLPAAAGAQSDFIRLKTYTPEEDARILKPFEGLRVADVSDGMDMAGLQDVGLMDPSVHALWRDTNDFSHRFVGIAVTVRYLPTNRRASKMGAEEFRKWEGAW